MGSPLSGNRFPASRLAVQGARAASPNGGVRVGEIQRVRILGALTELVHERGAGGVSVAHVVERSGVSRRTFYELFDDREDCFLAAFDRAITTAAESVVPAYEIDGRWRERIRAALAAVLVFLDEEPEMGGLCVVGALAAGPRALERRGRVIKAMVEVVHEGRLEARSERRVQRLVAEGVVGAILGLIHARLLEQRPKPLIGLLSPMMGIVVLPYLGAAAAERELARPTPRTRRASRQREDPLRNLHMRLTYRTVRVLLAIAASPAASNRQVAAAAGIADQGQISKLLSRLQALELVHNTGGDHTKGEPNAWTLTPKGQIVTQAIQTQTLGRSG